MIICNTKYYRGQDFAGYLAMPGTSFSSLKGDIPTSAGMMLGTRVHAYLNEPASYDWQQVEIVKPIAAALRGYLGEVYAHLEKEVAFTAEFTHNEMILLYKGRADLLSVGRIVVDLKVLSGPLQAACDRFGYPNQISGYCLATGASVGLIIAYNKARKEVEKIVIKPSKDFWQYITVTRGLPVAA